MTSSSTAFVFLPSVLAKRIKQFHKLTMARDRNRSQLEQTAFHFRYRLGEYALHGFVNFLSWAPDWIVRSFVSVMSRVTFLLFWQYRARMHANVTAALGSEIPDEAERKAIVRRAWRNFALGVLDTTKILHYSKQQVIARIEFSGEEHLKRALAKGKGVLALSAHLGGFTVLGPRLAAAGYPFSVVVKHPRDKRFAHAMNEYRANLGVHTISAKPRREAVRGILKALRENRIVMVIADEFKSGDVMINFFGQRCAAPRGPASLALRTGAATLPMFAVRRPDQSFMLTVHPEIEPVHKETLEESVAATTMVYSERLEEEIRRYPDQWNWLGFPRADRLSRAEEARLADIGAHESEDAESLNAKRSTVAVKQL